ncbi:unnamed protein product, partial [Urochloa humidicola]
GAPEREEEAATASIRAGEREEEEAPASIRVGDGGLLGSPRPLHPARSHGPSRAAARASGSRAPPRGPRRQPGHRALANLAMVAGWCSLLLPHPPSADLQGGEWASAADLQGERLRPRRHERRESAAAAPSRAARARAEEERRRRGTAPPQGL